MLQLAELEIRAGDLAQAEAYAAEFVNLDRQLRGDLGDEWYPSGAVAMHRGRIEDARRILTAGTEYARAIGSTIWLAHHLWALGHLELAAGNLVDARQRWDSCRGCSARQVSGSGLCTRSTQS